MEEFLDIVDENDNVVGKAPRKECHEKGLLHRVVDILILNSKGELLLQKRSEKMDTFPGYWTCSAGGHVNSGESYRDAVKRELNEELGIQIEVEEAGQLISNRPEHNQLIRLYSAVYEGPFNYNPEEIEALEFVSIGRIKREIRLYARKYTPGFIDMFRKFCEIRGL